MGGSHRQEVHIRHRVSFGNCCCSPSGIDNADFASQMIGILCHQPNGASANICDQQGIGILDYNITDQQGVVVA